MRIFLLAAVPLLAQADTDLFEKKVRPIFAAKCQQCHGAKMQMAGLNLATGKGLEPARLHEAVLYSGKYKMPPTGKLPDDEIAVIGEWIGKGGQWPEQTAVASNGAITDADRNHWAFRPLAKTPPDATIDSLIRAKLASKSIQPAARAPKLTLLRRATLDLTGLPPTLEEIAAFEADQSPQAFAKVIDRLLSSPRYGERWGRHWLDVARLADSTGMDEDNLYPHAWRYRDYVVEAFNNDVPYDRFIREQIAGDLLPAATKEERARNLTATGFLALGPRPLAQQDRLQAVYDIVDEQIDTTTKAFLGLTVACARCHDHKFDPILTTDYYALASIYASTTQFRNHGRPGSISYMYYAPVDADEQARYELHRSRMYAKLLEMEDAYAEDLGRDAAPHRAKAGANMEAAWRVMHQNAKASPDVEPWVKFLGAANDKARKGYLKKWLEATPETIAEVAAEYQKAFDESAKNWDQGLENWRKNMAREVLQDRALPERPKPNAEDPTFFQAVSFNGGPVDVPESPRVTYLRQEYQKLKDTLPAEPGLISAVTDGPVIDQRVFVRGQLSNPGDPVPKRFPLVLAGTDQKPVAKGSGRLELAEWIASPKNPLTARVMVNRIWQGHFGEGLVRTANNWGRTGEKPAQPELLDYLAAKFMEGGWSIKAMHRTIMLSEAYQRGTRAPKATREADPANRLYSRFHRQRMSVEQIRDSLLAIDGSLDTTMGGTLLVEKNGKRQKVDAEEITRRTLYLPVRRGNIPTLLNTFDFGDATTAGEGRNRTNVAPQALFLMNSKFVIERSRGLAKRLLGDASLADHQRVERAYLSILTRRPSAVEVDEGLSYIAAMKQRLSGEEASLTAWQSLCHVLMSTSEFLYVD